MYPNQFYLESSICSTVSCYMLDPSMMIKRQTGATERERESCSPMSSGNITWFFLFFFSSSSQVHGLHLPPPLNFYKTFWPIKDQHLLRWIRLGIPTNPKSKENKNKNKNPSPSQGAQYSQNPLTLNHILNERSQLTNTPKACSCKP